VLCAGGFSTCDIRVARSRRLRSVMCHDAYLPVAPQNCASTCLVFEQPAAWTAPLFEPAQEGTHRGYSWPAGTKAPIEGLTGIIGRTWSLRQTLPIVFPSIGTNPPIAGLTRHIGVTSSFRHEFPMGVPSMGLKPPMPGSTSTTGTTCALAHESPICATRGLKAPTAAITPNRNPKANGLTRCLCIATLQGPDHNTGRR